ncbi:MAG: hypothetical protein WCG27_13635, partial [Pseudomonadota bacterium]
MFINFKLCFNAFILFALFLPTMALTDDRADRKEMKKHQRLRDLKLKREVDEDEKFDPAFDAQLKLLSYAFTMSGIDHNKIEQFRQYTVGKNSYHINTANAPWAGYWWPLKKGGISLRWQQKTPIYPEIKEPEVGKSGQNDSPPDPRIFYPTLDQMIPTDQMVAKLKEMEASGDLRKLSPVEKFDIYVGDYHFNATKHSKDQRGPTTKEWDIFGSGWLGYCNGARAAGVLLPEPIAPLTVANPDGINITFDIADLKALGASAYYYVEKWAGLGGATRGSLYTFVVDGNQKPPNMGVFDIALRAFMGDAGKLFFMDK